MTQPIPALYPSQTNCGLFEVGFFSYTVPLTPKYEKDLRAKLKELTEKAKGGLYITLTPVQNQCYGKMVQEYGFKPVMVFDNWGGSREITMYVFGVNGVYPGYQGE